MDDKELQLKFLQFLAQKSGAKTQKDLEKYVQDLGEDGLKKAYEEFSKALQEEERKAQEEETTRAKKAAHGMKLNYVRNLKNQCADDEELVYFKKGGTLDCGCRKKMLKGGETPKEESMISKFKKFRLKAENTANKLSGKTYTEGKTIILRKADIEKAKKETEKQPNIDEEAVDMKPKKNCGGAKFKLACGKKIKKHRQGGSLNRVSFYLAGTPKGGLPTAQNAEERYAKGKARKIQLGPNTLLVLQYGFGIPGFVNPLMLPARIEQTVLGTDTTYTEHPKHLLFVKPVLRKASSSDTNRNEYNILKKRFNTAWNNATPMIW